MDNSDFFIVDEALPAAVDFEQLKSQGIDQLKNLVGKVWSNYNESDPGVTILDQLCYALTELGYCAEFPIADVLTQADNKIHFQDQFFKPQEILTCAPVTIDDYRKLVLDQVSDVRVIYIDVEYREETKEEKYATGRYKTYLSLKDNLLPTNATEWEEQVKKQVHSVLNQHRNLAEWFLLPEILTKNKITLQGGVCLTQTADVTQVRNQIIQTLLNYAAPMAIQSGYQELRDEGFVADQIFNGPNLQHGWMGGADALGSKCQEVRQFDLSALIAQINGVAWVESIQFEGLDSQINIIPTEIPDIILGENFEFLRNGSPVDSQPNLLKQTNPSTLLSKINQAIQQNQQYLTTLKTSHQVTSVAAAVDLYPALPQGHYRNIEQYYSVQNTFPDSYGIGYNSLHSDASSYRVANSRQLKGYLIVFDQLLANQFSQLAHVGDLFSFVPSHLKITTQSVVLSPAKAMQWSNAYSSIPHRKFVTTYYCQPLYSVPDVKPLLRGNEAFHYQFDPTEPDTKVMRKAWKQYQQFPFNEYVYGLRDYIESEMEANQRRDAMLTHLMARHGDDAARYDEMIKCFQWYGSELKTRIIVKSIWLQNYQLLSYYRTSAFDPYTASHLIAPNDLASGQQNKSATHQHRYPTVDGELDQAKIYADAEVTSEDLGNFSTFELKVGILLGLSSYLQALAHNIKIVLDDCRFANWLRDHATDAAVYLVPDSDLSIISIKSTQQNHFQHQLWEGQQCLLYIQGEFQSTASTEDDDQAQQDDSCTEKIEGYYRAHRAQLLWLATQRKGFVLVEHILLHGEQDPDLSFYFLKASLFFPAYVTLFNQSSFKRFIETLRDLHWPAHVEIYVKPKSFSDLGEIISKYVKWHNEQIKPYNPAQSQLRNLLSFHLAQRVKL